MFLFDLFCSRNLNFSRSSIINKQSHNHQNLILLQAHHTQVFFSVTSIVNLQSIKSQISVFLTLIFISAQSSITFVVIFTQQSQSSSSSAQSAQSSNQSHITKTRQKKTQNDQNNAKIMSSLHNNHWIHQNSTLHSTRSRRH